VHRIPWIKTWLPPGLGLVPGETAKLFELASSQSTLKLCPNVCIETAVERVTLRHMQQLRSTPKGLPDAIVTVTNDAWFNDSSVVQHHKRCAQLVAVACRRPILSAANNGPTAWIDSSGQIVAEIKQGNRGNVVATPKIDDRQSLVLTLGDWPARIAALMFLGILVIPRSFLGPHP
ncbi:MAG: apolipoprotein N-acyltransferase, partial [Planctomycetota bacterium]